MKASKTVPAAAEKEDRTTQDLLTVRLVPTIAFDYEARGIFPAARLPERPGRVPHACDVSVPRETAEAMLADAELRPEQLKREQPRSFKGGAVTAWHKLIDDLRWRLLSEAARDEITQAREARGAATQRSSDWFEALEHRYGYSETFSEVIREFRWKLTSEEIAERMQHAHDVYAEKRGDSAQQRMMLRFLELYEAAHEAAIERALDQTTWRTAGAAIERAKDATEGKLVWRDGAPPIGHYGVDGE